MILCNISFSLEIDIPEKSEINVWFPRIYDLQNIDPKIKIETNIENDQIRFRTTLNKITISNLPKIEQNTEFQISIKGIRNPDYEFLI